VVRETHPHGTRQRETKVKIMWPDLFGPGWVWGMLVSSCAIAAVVVGLFRTLNFTGGESGRSGDSVQALWHRYEEGDLTQWEFERMKQRIAPWGHRV
jgi:uncharacterized membrane protein